MLTNARLLWRAHGPRSLRYPRIPKTNGFVRSLTTAPADDDNDDEAIDRKVMGSSKWKRAMSGTEKPQETPTKDIFEILEAGEKEEALAVDDWRVPAHLEEDGEDDEAPEIPPELKEVEKAFKDWEAAGGYNPIDPNYSAVAWLESSADGTNVAWSRHATLHKGKPLLARYNYKRAAKTMTKEAIQKRPQTMWRYHELLPIPTEDDIVSLGEMMTPLLELPTLSDRLGIEDGAVLLKDDSRMPTGSTKARGMAVAVSMAKGSGHPVLTITSTGNDAQALTAYATRARVPSNTWMGLDSPVALQQGVGVAGGISFVTDGTYADHLSIIKKGSHFLRWFDLTAFHEPYRLEGDKTIIFEIVEQLGWDVPDVIIVPLATGSSLVGIYKGLEELREVGLLPKDVKFPRLVGVQLDSCPPLADAFLRAEADIKHHYPRHPTRINELNMPYTNASELVLKYTRATGGMLVSVNTEQIGEFATAIGWAEGVVCSPETSACVGALKSLTDSGWVKQDEVVVLLNTATPERSLEFWKETVDRPIVMDKKKIDWASLKEGAIDPDEDPFWWDTKDRNAELQVVRDFEKQNDTEGDGEELEGEVLKDLEENVDEHP